MFLMTKGEPHYYPGSLINGRTCFTCYVPSVWGVHEWESNFLLRTQATSPLLNPGGSSGEGVSVLRQIFPRWRRPWAAFE